MASSSATDSASRHAPAHCAPALPPALSRAASIGLLLILAYLAYTRLYWVRKQAEDFEFFYHAGSALLQHGNMDAGFDTDTDGARVARGTIPWYPPFVARLMTIPAWLGQSGCAVFGLAEDAQRAERAIPQTPFRWADALWMCGNLAAFAALLRLIARNMLELPVGQWPAWCILPMAAAAMFIHWEFRLNQLDTLTLLLLVGSFVCWQHGRTSISGFWLGLAVLLKVTPALLIAWFVLKRQWRTTTIAAITIALAGPVADFVVFGREYTGELYGAWMRNVREGSQRELIADQREMDWRNQALGAVMARSLAHTNVATTFQNDPRAERFNEEPRYANFAELDRTTLGLLVTAVSAGSLLGLCWLARRPARAMSGWELRMEWALFLLAMLWLMPVMRRYHLIWTLPALMLLLARVYHERAATGWARLSALCVMFIAALPIAALAPVQLGYRMFDVYGVFLAGVAVLALPIILFLAGRGSGAELNAPLPIVADAEGAARDSRRGELAMVNG